MSEGKVWFITGTSRGFGRLWTDAALQRGDRVVATARKTDALADLVAQYGDAILALPLDVTNRDAVFAAVEQGHRQFGRLDIVVCNAGYGATGMVEEIGLDSARLNVETNLFGTLSLIQAALPIMRAQGSGHIIPISSVAGLVSFPTSGVYSATKAAVNALAEALAQEVAGFGIKVTTVEPGPFATDFSGDSLQPSPIIDAYAAQHEALRAMFDVSSFADPKLTIAPILKLVDMEQPPQHLMLSTMLPLVEQVYAGRLAALRESLALSA